MYKYFLINKFIPAIMLLVIYGLGSLLSYYWRPPGSPLWMTFIIGAPFLGIIISLVLGIIIIFIAFVLDIWGKLQ